ncbi:MAG: SET domain-containing protein-lysine N-methyltransferase [Patescibacteria group bacterium]|jgi:hypothetical protein
MIDSLEIKKSGISTNGVFALKKFKKGETIIFLTGVPCTLDEMIENVDNGLEASSDPLGVDDDQYLDLDELPRTFNHSCGPNAFIRGRNELVALKNIKIGDEITFDYSTTMNDNKKRIEETGGALWTCKCRCGAKNCRGIINQFKTLPKSVQNFYIKNKFMPDFMLKHFK